MSGTSLLILAMYSTVNVVGPSGSHLATAALPAIMCLLMFAAVLTCAAMLAETALPERRLVDGPATNGLRRRHAGPKPRRA